jgi:SAM-dependent methyltransferase
MSRCPADLYDAFADALGKDYEAEARTVLRLVRSRRRGRGALRTLLDVACGTGRHLAAFGPRLEVTGLDRDRAMLRAAAARCPGARLVRGDMAEFDLGQRFDVVTCLFSSIAYLLTAGELRRAVATMAGHLEPGGVLVVEPWYDPEDWDDECAREGTVDLLVVDDPSRKAVRLCRSSRRGDVSAVEFDVLVADEGGTRRFREHHELGLYALDEYVAAFEAAGLDTTVDDYGLWGHGLVLGAKPSRV